MRKSLVMLIVIAAAVALCGVAFAQVCGPAGCAPVCLEPGAIPAKPKPVTALAYPTFKPKGPECKLVPCPNQKVSIPGEPYMLMPVPYIVTVPKVKPVWRDLCKGAAVGKCANGCLPPTTWAAAWVTKEKLCEKKVMVPVKGFVNAPVRVPCDVPATCDVTCLDKLVLVPKVVEVFDKVWVPGAPIKPTPCCK